MKKVFILILNYNGYEDTRMCLPTLKKLSCPGFGVETIVIDNGSDPDQRKLLLNLVKKYPHVNIIENGRNLGFAAGNNVGIQYALSCGADYVLLLNNDTKVETNFLKHLLTLNLPIVSPVVKYPVHLGKDKMLYDLGGYVNWWTGRTAHINVENDKLDEYAYKKSIPVDYVSGCCMLVSRDVFQKIGFLDESYFMYFEDVDFCVTAKKKGFGVYVDPKSSVYHKMGGSIQRWSKRAIFHNLFGNLIFITKHLGIRRITGYSYLFALTLKIIIDRLRHNY